MKKVLWALIAVAAVAWSSLYARRTPPPASAAGDSNVVSAVTRLPWASYLVTDNRDGNLRAGVYLSERPMDAEVVRTLCVHQPNDPRWKGVLRITAHRPSPLDAEEFADWNENARFVGGLLLIGDPTLVRRAPDELAR
jgi:hypothetical protein